MAGGKVSLYCPLKAPAGEKVLYSLLEELLRGGRVALTVGKVALAGGKVALAGNKVLYPPREQIFYVRHLVVLPKNQEKTFPSQIFMLCPFLMSQLVDSNI
jgi:hypothetical protein